MASGLVRVGVEHEPGRAVGRRTARVPLIGEAVAVRIDRRSRIERKRVESVHHAVGVRVVARSVIADDDAVRPHAHDDVSVRRLEDAARNTVELALLDDPKRGVASLDSGSAADGSQHDEPVPGIPDRGRDAARDSACPGQVRGPEKVSATDQDQVSGRREDDRRHDPVRAVIGRLAGRYDGPRHLIDLLVVQIVWRDTVPEEVDASLRLVEGVDARVVVPIGACPQRAVRAEHVMRRPRSGAVLSEQEVAGVA